ncbi:MAG: ribosome-recycling factor [Puia sp.]
MGKEYVTTIERAIINANLGVTPQNDGNTIRLFMPPLTEERRKDL